MSLTKHEKKLRKAPLKEVIFDVRWELDEDAKNQRYDDRFDLAVGKFQQAVAKDFPQVKRTIPPDIPKGLTNYLPKFQFLVKNANFPLIQLGEGIMTINNNDETYVWNTQFYPLIDSALQKLKNSYDGEINFNRVSLRYIDVVSIENETRNSLLKFLAENFNYQVSKTFNCPGQLNAFNFSEQRYITDEYYLNIDYSTALNKKNELQLMWQMTIFNPKLGNNPDLLNWAQHAHKITSDLFVNMLKPEFYDSFK